MPQADMPDSSAPEDAWIAQPQPGDLEFGGEEKHGVVELRLRRPAGDRSLQTSLFVDGISVGWDARAGQPLFFAIPEGEHALELTVFDHSEIVGRADHTFAAARGCRLLVDVLIDPSSTRVEQRLICRHANPALAVPQPPLLTPMPEASDPRFEPWLGTREKQVDKARTFITLAMHAAHDESSHLALVCLRRKLTEVEGALAALRAIERVEGDRASVAEQASQEAFDAQLSARRCGFDASSLTIGEPMWIASD